MMNVANEPRSSGDGMDYSAVPQYGSKSKMANVKVHQTQNIIRSMRPIIPKEPIINLIPKYMPKERKKPKCLIGKPKEPKFIPYEPYKGAVEPIVPLRKPIQKNRLEKTSKNNIDIQDLVCHISEMRSLELRKSSISSNEPVISKLQWETEKNSLEIDIKNLQETNSHLENQLKLQTQVNSELKTLLVAAVGEDLESRVEHLTADKLQLARALLDSAHHLTSHQEQTEWLSGQCEVWRSKFLASSLMVEELAKWKSALMNRLTEISTTVKKLLEERNKIHCSSLQIYRNLDNIINKRGFIKGHSVNLKSTNVVDLSEVNHILSDAIARNMLSFDENNEFNDSDQLLSLPRDTHAEQEALKLLNNPVTLPEKPDLICNALMGAAMAIGGGGQMFLQHPTLHATCCAHCKGEVQDI